MGFVIKMPFVGFELLFCLLVYLVCLEFVYACLLLIEFLVLLFRGVFASFEDLVCFDFDFMCCYVLLFIVVGLCCLN